MLLLAACAAPRGDVTERPASGPRVAEALSPPDGLAATADGGAVELSWTGRRESALYFIYRSRSPAGGYRFVASVLGATAYRDAALAGGTYYYVVSEVDRAGKESAPSNQASVSLPGEGPEYPAQAENTSGASVTLVWDPPAANADGTPLTDLAGYRVYRGREPARYDTFTDVGMTTEATVQGLESGRQYFAVTAYDRSGNESAFSNEISVTVP